MNYITQQDVEYYLGVTLTGNGVNTFTLLQQPMQDLVDIYLNRSFNFSNPVTETFDLWQPTNPPTLNDTFFPKYMVSETPANNAYPQAKGIVSITAGIVNGQGGVNIDLTYVYSYKTSIKFFNWFAVTPLFNPIGYKSVQIVYNSDDANGLPNPVKLALIQWIARMITTAPDAGRDVTQVQAGTIKAIYKEDGTPAIPDFVKFVLDRYRMPVLDHF